MGQAKASQEPEKLAQSVEFYAQAIKNDPHNLTHYTNMAAVLYMQKNLTGAREYYARALMLQPGNAMLFNNHGYISYELGDLPNAVESLQKAVFYEPNNKQFKLGFVKALADTAYARFSETAKVAITACLEDENIYHQALMRPWQSLLHYDPVFEPLRRLADFRGQEISSLNVPLEELLPCMEERFFLLGLKRCVITYIGLENGVTALRGILLRTIREGLTEEKLAKVIPFLQSLAEQCWYNEYIFNIGQEEEEGLEELWTGLEKDFDARNREHLARLLICASYRPLYTHLTAGALSAAIHESGDEGIQHIARLQIDAPLEERAIRKNIKTFGSISNDVSQKVRDQYEHNPYPRWKAVDIYEREAQHAGKEILIAGCGTGREVAFQLMEWPGAKITAADLSLSSLSYAKRQLEKVGLKDGYELLQGDILELDSLGRKYDFVVSSGVIHHMQDPMAGWKMLQSLLKPGAMLRLGLYSAAARKPITLGREYIAQKGYEPTPDNIRKVRNEIVALPEGEPLKKCMDWRDFFNMSECRDHLFHVQEHQFTLPQIKESLEELGMEFCGFVMNTNTRFLNYRRRFPDDLQGLNLDNWHILEQENPMLFSDMYQFNCRNK